VFQADELPLDELTKRLLNLGRLDGEAPEDLDFDI
jgi:hypothetical protein